MVRLRVEVKAQALAKQKMLEALHEELVQAETGQDDNILEIRRKRRAITGSGPSYMNRTPIIGSFRHTTRHDWRDRSQSNTRSKVPGTGL